MSISAIDSPIEQRNTGKGRPSAILHWDRPLNNRQQALLDKLPDFNSRVLVHKSNVKVMDLAALTAVTGDEFAMFTRGSQRLIIRGNAIEVDIGSEEALMLNSKGFRWSLHTHPGIEDLCLTASDGDRAVLKCFAQEQSVIYNSKGRFRRFFKEE